MCKVENCSVKAYGHGLCERHYTQIRKYGKIKITHRDVIRFEEKEECVLVYFYNRLLERVATAIIDIDDYSKIKNYVWFLDKDGYAIAHKEKTTIKMHRVIAGALDEEHVDHKDLNILNNRKNNLRICNISQNNYNRNATKTNGLCIKGVSYHRKREVWVAQITHKGKHYNLGDFKNPLEAAIAYNTASKKYAGLFARLNDLSWVKLICVERGLL